MILKNLDRDQYNEKGAENYNCITRLMALQVGPGHFGRDQRRNIYDAQRTVKTVKRKHASLSSMCQSYGLLDVVAESFLNPVYGREQRVAIRAIHFFG